MPAWMRWIHTYFSMLGLGTLLFFSLTGLTLNHPDWTLGSRRAESKVSGSIPPGLLAPGSAEAQVDRLAIAEHLRRAHGLRGLVEDFRVDDRECTIAFKGPASSADITVDRTTGRYEGTAMAEGWLALVNDLHKGRHTGTVWTTLIDVTAVLLTLVSLTGLWLLVYVRRRRWTGLWVGLAGAGLLVLFHFVSR